MPDLLPLLPLVLADWRSADGLEPCLRLPDELLPLRARELPALLERELLDRWLAADLRVPDEPELPEERELPDERALLDGFELLGLLRELPADRDPLPADRDALPEERDALPEDRDALAVLLLDPVPL